jgi:hypothetical protein
MFQGKFHPDFYRVLHKVIHKKLRIWQTRDMLAGFVTGSRLPRHGDASRLVKSLYHAATLPAYQLRLRSFPERQLQTAGMP